MVLVPQKSVGVSNPFCGCTILQVLFHTAQTALGAFTVYWSLLKLGILRYSEVTAGKVIERIYTVGFMKKH